MKNKGIEQTGISLRITGIKLEEIRHVAVTHIHLLSLADLGFTGDIPEEEDTIEGNAAQKAWFIYDRYADQLLCR